MASTLIPPQHRSIIARILAVVALVACAIALLSIYNGFHSDEDSTQAAHGRKGNHQSKGSKKNQADVPKTYVVQEGDNLGIVADKFNVAVPRLEKLNPKIDPQTLHAGQTLILR